MSQLLYRLDRLAPDAAGGWSPLLGFPGEFRLNATVPLSMRWAVTIPYR